MIVIKPKPTILTQVKTVLLGFLSYLLLLRISFIPVTIVQSFFMHFKNIFKIKVKEQTPFTFY